MRKPSPAVIIAVVALFFSLGGGAYAASRVLITNIHQIGPGVRAQLRGHRGPVGPRGLPGTAGSQGAAGPQGHAAESVNAVEFGQNEVTVPASGTFTVTATCPNDNVDLGGGYKVLEGVTVTSEQPTADGTGWIVTAQAATQPPRPGGKQFNTLVAFALCT